MSPLVALALQYAKDHDEEILTLGYEALKRAVEAKLEERRKARASIADDRKQLDLIRAEVDDALKDG